MRPAAALPALVVLSLASEAGGYEFEIAARTLAQAYQLRSPRLDERDVFLNRRRLTQTLDLDIWGILEPRYDAGRPDPPPLAPFDVYVSASGRVLHDFGDFTDGAVIHGLPGSSSTGTIAEGATSAVPELAGESLQLEVLWAVIGARGILDRVDVAFGRQLVVGELDWYAFDGLALAARLPWHLALEAQAGLLVRDGSPVASGTHEPDGSSSGQCVAYAVDQDSFLPASCATRDAAAPTFGVAVASHGLRDLTARVSYRRTVSRTAGGVYPDVRDQAPSWGVLEEKLAGNVRARLAGGALTPWAAARWNILAGVIDEANAGLRLTLGDHSLTPEWRWSFPTFDGDSIWNVFAIEPFWEGRLAYELWPGHGRLRATARVFTRQFDGASAGGGLVGARLAIPGGSLRLEGSYEDGYGGLRAGGDLSGRWRAHRRIELEGRLSLVRLEKDDQPDIHATTFAGQAGAVFMLGPRMTLHVVAEENVNRMNDQLRLMALLDLAFRPEL